MQPAESQDHVGAPVAIDPVVARSKLASAGRLHWIHWAIILLSLILSCTAWRYADSVFEARIQESFDLEHGRVIELVQERLQKYEDALWAGVAMTYASAGDVDFERWRKYANSLHVERKYRGINGIGMIHALSPEEVPDYLEEQRRLRPTFEIHPPRVSGSSQRDDRFYPISYIIPFKGNDQAVGLDMACEANRLSTVLRARDTGEAQITAPLTLIQEELTTPGFLFFAPFYRGPVLERGQSRPQKFAGLVYAPFVVKKLMEGTLGKEKRPVGIRLVDDGVVLYDEHVDPEPDFDPNPLFTRATEVSLYGRTWVFDIWSTRSFRQIADSNQSYWILVGGIIIDVLLVFLFVSITRSARKALGYADAMTLQLEMNQLVLAERARQLEQSNQELEQFACVASHDLQEPLRKVASFCGLLEKEYGDLLDEEGRLYVQYAVDGATRMRTVIQDLLAFSKIGSLDGADCQTDAADALAAARLDLAAAIEESQAIITHDPLPDGVLIAKRRLVQLFQNLVGNSIKYRGPRRPVIHIGVESLPDEWQFSVSDNGIGIEPEFSQRVFGIFKRLHSKTEYSGNGIGLAICKRIVQRLNGRIWVEQKPGPGSKICFTIPKKQISQGSLGTSQTGNHREYATAGSD